MIRWLLIALPLTNLTFTIVFVAPIFTPIEKLKKRRFGHVGKIDATNCVNIAFVSACSCGCLCVCLRVCLCVRWVCFVVVRYCWLLVVCVVSLCSFYRLGGLFLLARFDDYGTSCCFDNQRMRMTRRYYCYY